MKGNKFTRLCKMAWLAPHDLVSTLQFLWRHGPVSHKNAERVDRLCNPAKYRGKQSEIDEFARTRRFIGRMHYFSWALLTLGASLIALGSLGRLPNFLGPNAAWTILLGCSVIIAGFGLLLRRRSL